MSSALAFGYCEALLQLADPQRVLGEIARLTSLNNLLDSVGYESTVYEDFVDETLQLLRRIADGFPNQDGSTALLENFNDREVCDAIIMHFRSHAEEYGNYIEDFSTVEQYCAAHIEPHAVEIEHLGLQICIDAIIKPAGINVQVLVLDRTPGEQVNQIDWNAEAPTTTAQGHYDILYKIEDVPPPPFTMVTNPQIHLMSDPMYMASSNLLYSQQGLDLNTFYIPGLTSAGISPMPFSSNTFQSEPTYAPSSLPVTSAPTEAFSAPYSEPPYPVISSPPVEGPWSAGAFRPSMYQVEDQFRSVMPTRPEPCQTEAMRQ
ncbi:MAG: hypothetical protein Q9220_005161 [cf. Caloplaca sp. 1 TL-2023]